MSDASPPKDRPAEFFDGLKAATTGMMPSESYRELYRAAVGGAGDVIDVGVGRGATTIALALGVRDSGRDVEVHAVDQFWQQLTSGPHRYSGSDYPREACVALNVAEFRRNLARFGAAAATTLHVGTTDEVAPGFPAVAAGVLSIDVDGMIDRDLAHFYDRVIDGGIIAIDDCSDAISRRGRANLAKRPAVDAEGWVQSLRQFDRRRLLGKHILIHKLASHFVALGVLEPVRVVGVTAFFRKPRGAPRYRDIDLGGIARIEDEIVARYLKEPVTSEGNEATGDESTRPQ